MDTYGVDETNYTYDYFDASGSSFNSYALFQCIIRVIESIVYIFITSAIISDRQRYEKTFLWALLNFSLAYFLSCILKYFADVHIVVFGESNKSVCHTVFFLNNVIGDATEMAILPVCIDLIVRIKKTEYYEKRKYRSFMLILILVIWIVAIINEIINRSFSRFEMYCYESNPAWAMWFVFAFHILRTLIILVVAIFLVFVAITSSQSLSQSAKMTSAPVLISTFMCVANIMYFIYYVSIMNNYGEMRDLAQVNYYIRLFIPIIFALMWLLDGKFRKSVKKLLICSPCRKTGPQPTEHELTPGIA